MMETEMDRFTPSARLTTPELDRTFNVRAVFEHLRIFILFFWTDANKHFPLFACFISEQSLPILKDSRNSI